MNCFSKGKYEGDLLENWYHGKGKFTFETGVVYDGEFEKGEFHGEGTLYYPNGVNIEKNYFIIRENTRVGGTAANFNLEIMCFLTDCPTRSLLNGAIALLKIGDFIMKYYMI